MIKLRQKKTHNLMNDHQMLQDYFGSPLSARTIYAHNLGREIDVCSTIAIQIYASWSPF